MHEVQDALGELGSELGVVLESAGVHQLPDLLGDGFADAGQLLEVLLVADHLLKLCRQPVDGAGGALVGADGEAGLAFHLHQARDVFEYLCDL